MSATPANALGPAKPYCLKPGEKTRLTDGCGFFHIVASSGQFVAYNARFFPTRRFIEADDEGVYPCIDLYVENNGSVDCHISVTLVAMKFPKECGMPTANMLVA